MSLAEALNAREVYERVTSHAELLKHIKVPIVKKVAHCIRSWKTRHSLPTLEQAFADHRQYESILLPKPEATSARSEEPVVAVSLDAAPLTSAITPLQHSSESSCSSLPLPSAALLLPSAAPLPSAHVSHEVASVPPPPLAEEHNAQSQSPALTTERQQQRQQQPQQQPQPTQQQDDVIAGLVRDVAALRGLLLQHQTPSALRFNSIPTRFRKHCRVLSIVGDGRCQLYSLLQVERAMLPTAYEADELLTKLRGHLLQSYTEDEWRETCPLGSPGDHLIAAVC